jgi:hypothetical protein
MDIEDKYSLPPRLNHVWKPAEILAIQEREVLKARYIAEGSKKVVHTSWKSLDYLVFKSPASISSKICTKN